MRVPSVFPILLAALAVVFTGCKKEEAAPGFDMIYQENFTVPAGIGPFVTHHFYLKNLSTRYEALLDQYGKTDLEITRILPVQAALTGIFGDANFNAVEEASLRVYQESDPGGYIEVAYRFPTPIEPNNTLDLIPSLADAKRIMSDDRFSIDLALRLRNTTTDEIPVRLSLQLKANY
ncbi:MAG: hypothetical protein IPH12_00325 [Saprospirales bacterium]|jgi:hypothetical protein|nr:hypothetical protein [Saprospirales bacterium]MBK8923930.1 hypothetical protein [Saprospirales bacterium]